MNKIVNAMVIVLVAVLICAQVPAAKAESGLKTISLVYSDHSLPDIGGVHFFKNEYIPKIQKELAKIGYKLDITFHHAESLYKYAEQVQACADGHVDITLFSISYDAERAPLHQILDMPLVGFQEQSANQAWFELQETIPEFGAELGEFKEICHFSALPNAFNTNKPVRVPEDFKGLKINAAGMTADMLKSAGADIVMLMPSEWHSALESKAIDGVAMGISGIPMYKLQDVIQYHIQPSGDSLGLNGTSFIMNREKFESLPAGVQKVIDDNVMWASKKLTAMEVSNIPKQVEICKKSGNEVISLTSTEMMKWYILIRPLHQRWIRKMEAMGLPGKKVYDEAKRLAEKYKAEE